MIITDEVTNVLSEQQQSQNSHQFDLSKLDQNGMIMQQQPNSDQSALLSQFVSRTGMNLAYSMQCLKECEFNLDLALESFKRVYDAGLLPGEAFQ